MELVFFDSDNKTVDELKKNICDDIISIIIDINDKYEGWHISNFSSYYRSIEKRRIEIYGLGYIVIPDNRDAYEFLCSIELKEKIFSILISLDIETFLFVCEKYVSILINTYNKNYVREDLYIKYNELKYIINKQRADENKQAKELSSKMEDFMNMFNDVGSLNSQKK